MGAEEVSPPYRIECAENTSPIRPIASAAHLVVVPKWYVIPEGDASFSPLRPIGLLLSCYFFRKDYARRSFPSAYRGRGAPCARVSVYDSRVYLVANSPFCMAWVVHLAFAAGRLRPSREDGGAHCYRRRCYYMVLSGRPLA